MWEDRRKGKESQEAKKVEAFRDEEESEAEDEKSTIQRHGRMSRTNSGKRKETGNGDGKPDEAGVKDQDATKAQPSPAQGNASGGEPSIDGANKTTEYPFEFTDEEHLITWLQRLEKANNDAAKFPVTVMLPLTAKQKQALREQLEDDLDSYQPTKLDDI